METFLNLNSNSVLFLLGVRSLVTKNPTISKLNLGFCYKVTDEVVPDIARCLGSNLVSSLFSSLA